MNKEEAAKYLDIANKDKYITHDFIHTIFKLGLCDMYIIQKMRLITILVRCKHELII